MSSKMWSSTSNQLTVRLPIRMQRQHTVRVCIISDGETDLGKFRITLGIRQYHSTNSSVREVDLCGGCVDFWIQNLATAEM